MSAFVQFVVCMQVCIKLNNCIDPDPFNLSLPSPPPPPPVSGEFSALQEMERRNRSLQTTPSFSWT